MIPLYAPEIGDNARHYVADCLNSGWVSRRGRYVKLFEERFAAYIGTRFAIATQSGTAALHLALAALGIGEGDEVIVPALTFVSCANAVAYVGAEPVFVDSEPQTGTLDPELVALQITPLTRAIMSVHLYGHPANMEAIQTLAHRHNLAVIEDAAGALGAKYQSQSAGTLGSMGCFSFYANKLVTTGGGGMLVTNDPQLAAQAAWLSNYARDEPGDFVHREIGFNYRLSAVQAALGLAQLERADEWLRRKRNNAQLYNRLLAPVSGIVCPTEAPWAIHSYGLYSIKVKDEYPLSAAELGDALKEQGIETRRYFVPLTDLLPYRCHRSTPLPVAHLLRQTGLCLPSSPQLTPDEIRFVASVIRKFGQTALNSCTSV
jgi:perosamine synthetase